MDHDVIESEIIETEAGIFRVEYRPDHDAESPRGTYSNLGVMIIDDEMQVDDTVTSLDSWPRSRQTVREGMREINSVVHRMITAVREDEISPAAACRYLRLVTGAWAVLPIDVTDHRYHYSVSAGDPDDARRGDPVSGFVLDTARTREEMGPQTPEQAAQWLREEIEALNRWAEGEYVFYTVERMFVDDWDEDRPDVDDVEADPDAYAWVVVDSLSGIDDLAYAREEARASVQGFTPDDFPSRHAARALAAQV